MHTALDDDLAGLATPCATNDCAAQVSILAVISETPPRDIIQWFAVVSCHEANTM